MYEFNNATKTYELGEEPRLLPFERLFLHCVRSINF